MAPKQERAFALSIARCLLRFFTPRSLSSTLCTPTMAEPDPIPHMRHALSMAEHALNTNETPVGCILLHPTHSLISTGQNATNRTYNGTMHAEFIAISSFLSPPSSSPFAALTLPERLKILQESTLYVTVEPCIMCASLLRQFGITKVFFGCSNEKFGGNGGVLDIHVSNGRYTEIDKERGGNGGREKEEGDYEVSGGWLREEAIVMLRRFYVQENGRAPEPRTKRERVLKLEVDSPEERKRKEEEARAELKKEQQKREQTKREEKKAEAAKAAQAKAEQMKAEQAKAKQKAETKRSSDNWNGKPRRASSASSSSSYRGRASSASSTSSNGRGRGDGRRVFGDRANGQWARRGSQDRAKGQWERRGSQDSGAGSQERRGISQPRGRYGRVAWGGPAEKKIQELKEAMDTSIIPAAKHNQK